MNNIRTDIMYSSKKDSWSTPEWLFNKLNMEFNFTLDPCCTEQNAKCKKYYTEQDNGLIQNWNNEIVFMNPPYCRKTKFWVKKAYDESLNGAVVVALLPSRTDVSWFHDYIYNKPNIEIRFLKGRLKFGDSKNSAPFPSMIVVFNN